MIFKRIILSIVIVIQFQVHYAQIKDSEIRQLNVHEIDRLNKHQGINFLEKIYFSDSLFLSNRNEDELNYIGGVFMKESKNEIAKEIFNYTIKLHPESSTAHSFLYKIYLNEGNYNEALYSLKNASLYSESPIFSNLPFLFSSEYSSTELPVKDLDLFLSNNNWSSDTVLVYVQGGPDFKLRLNENDALALMTNAKDVLKVYPYQSSILNPRILTAKPGINLEQARFELKNSSEILKRTLNYLHKKNKKIFLIGFSHGATICSEYLASEEKIPVQKIYLIGNQLNNTSELKMHDDLKTGEIIRWKDGEEPIHFDLFYDIPKDFPMKNHYSIIANNIKNLEYSSYRNNYCELIKSCHFNKINMIYATKDESAGPVSLQEITFLDSLNVNYFELETTHQGLINQQNMNAIWNHIQTDNPLLFNLNTYKNPHPEVIELAIEAITHNEKIIQEVGGIVAFGEFPEVSFSFKLGFGSAVVKLRVIGKLKNIFAIAYLTRDPGKDWSLIEIQR